MKRLLYYLPVLYLATCCSTQVSAASGDTLRIMRCTDFTVTGYGDNPAWNNTSWIELQQRGGMDRPQATRIKTLYSESGIYFLFRCADTQLTATMEADNLELWREDVVEIFLAPDPDCWDHFEYELSPLGYQLPLHVARQGGRIARWIPFRIAGSDDPQIGRAVTVEGGRQAPTARVTGWTAECYIPFAALSPFKNTPPQSGTVWRGNFYRVDYDYNETIDWVWRPVSGSYHNTDEYGTLIFE